MRKDYEKLFTNLEPPEPQVGLFDRILLAIKREQELRSSKRLAFGFLALLAISFIATPFSWTLFSGQMAESGVLQFISVAMSDLGTFLSIWPDSVVAVAESLPVTGIILLTVNMILAIFTLRLFLYKKRLLVGYLFHAGQLA
ncbi:hypothetical protein A2Z53_01950 [Candidatus Giovannonibacteria bacterium RIFCSPHIGHO2_02_42_15]|uniref:Uncharacterized protein n=2 Tax=Candidatus Giovannoniibacteriota TaxID=1752738 RepID=A0A1F5VPI6_9BACT|nr:MAG: hypothetical protein UV11_C0009G0002 [Candidatus Giovannonibacteria bacterium GW2011_GWF2_42_19]OGF65362.1 MAG: hypothetical protein A2Z53_01950 [Candidatus Giovannonibacteria bacterium RIFCSPHIGHO2_02_42_15]HBB49354.1 hypothetical protein [Candidatus Nomurabacteria bacterium]